MYTLENTRYFQIPLFINVSRTYSSFSDTTLTQHDFIHIRMPSIHNLCAVSSIWMKQI